MTFTNSPAYQIFIIIDGLPSPFSDLYKNYPAAKKKLEQLRSNDCDHNYRLAAASRWTIKEV